MKSLNDCGMWGSPTILCSEYIKIHVKGGIPMRNIAKRSVALLLLVAMVLSVCQGVVVPTFAGAVCILFRFCLPGCFVPAMGQ